MLHALPLKVFDLVMLMIFGEMCTSHEASYEVIYLFIILLKMQTLALFAVCNLKFYDSRSDVTESCEHALTPCVIVYFVIPLKLSGKYKYHLL